MPKIPSFKTGMTIACVTLVVLYSAGLGLIFFAVDGVAEDARATYPGDHVEALIALVEDKAAPLEKRHSAIWALGQIGDKRALPTLRALDTHGDTSEGIAQSDVNEAIQQTEKGSATRWVYRFL